LFVKFYRPALARLPVGGCKKHRCGTFPEATLAQVDFQAEPVHGGVTEPEEIVFRECGAVLRVSSFL
jgi:hypothetical protein